MEVEIWKDFPGYEGFYQVSNLGRVRRVMALGRDKNGYERVTFTKNGKRKTYAVHRLVAQLFIENPDNRHEVNHINGIKDDNRSSNLEWVTTSENQIHSHRVLGNKSVPHNCKKVRCIETGQIFPSLIEAGRQIGYSRHTIRDAINGRKGCKTCAGYHWEFVNEKSPKENR